MSKNAYKKALRDHHVTLEYSYKKKDSNGVEHTIYHTSWVDYGAKSN